MPRPWLVNGARNPALINDLKERVFQGIRSLKGSL